MNLNIKHIRNKLNYYITAYNERTQSFLEDYLKAYFKKQRLKAVYKKPKHETIEAEPSQLIKKNIIEEGLEIITFKNYIAKTISVYNPFDLKKRDLGRPEKDFLKSISIRLAKILINISAKFVSPLLSLTVRIILKFPLALNICVILDPSATPPSPKSQRYETISPSSSYESDPSKNISSPTVASSGEEMTAVGNLFVFVIIFSLPGVRVVVQTHSSFSLAQDSSSPAGPRNSTELIELLSGANIFTVSRPVLFRAMPVIFLLKTKNLFAFILVSEKSDDFTVYLLALASPIFQSFKSTSLLLIFFSF